MKTKKALGQNFLVDPQVVNDLLDTAEINNQDTVLEVGAGIGAVTRPLAKRAGKVIAVEIDKDLILQLQTNLKGSENVEIINEDILKLQITNYELRNFKVVGSIPYQITSPLIHKLLKEEPRPVSITIIVQREVAEKIVAQPPAATYLSNFVANFGQAEIVRTIKPDAFLPQPKVDSAILRISLNPSTRSGSAFGGKPYTSDAKRFENFLHRGFAQPRKMLNKQFPTEVLEEVGIDPQRRPQTLEFEEWIRLFEAVKCGDGVSTTTP